MMKLCSILLCALAFGLATASSKQGAGPSSAAAGQQQQAAKPSISTSSNPLVPNGLFPQWDKIKPESIEPAVKQVLQEEGAALDLLEADLEAAGKDITYERIYRPYAQIRYRLDSTYGLLDHLETTMDDPAQRKAIQKMQPDRVTFELRFAQSKPLYKAIMHLRNTPELWNKLNPVQKRIVDISTKEFQTSGVGLDDAKRKYYNELIGKLSKLSTNFTNNVLDSTSQFKLLITDKKQMEGLEPTTLAVTAKKAAEEGHKGATAEAGPWMVTLDYSTYNAVVSFAKDRELRKKLYIAYRRIAADNSTDNTNVIKQLLAIRQELSQLIGFPNYAEQSFLGKMATLKKANALMDELTVIARPVAVREDAAMRAFARNVSGDPSLELQLWDNAYWAERLKEAKFRVKQEELRQYLPLENVREGMFRLAKRLYGVTLKPSQQKLPVWHPDVAVYEVYDGNSTTPMAFLYADFYARPGTKQGGAWVQSLADRAHYWREPSPAARAAAEIRARGGNSTKLYSAQLAKEQADWLAKAPLQLPVAVLVSNQNPPAGGKPSLMSLDDAETLFHEFGHSLQAMLTQVKEPLVAGMRNIEWDAVEAPSQMQEKWVYDKGTFNSFARHWKTNETVSPELFDRISAMRTYRRGNYFTYQLMLATTDMILHSTFDPAGSKTASDVQHEQYKKIMPFPPLPQDRQINSFSHIFTGGYSSGYYSYLWSDVMSADGFMAFVEAGTNNEAEVQRLGRRFRDTFFALGGSVAPDEVYRRFRGREPLMQSVIKYNKLDQAQ